MKKLLFLLLISTSAIAQISLPVPLNIQSTYDKGTRSTDGKPGKNYWQNSADYTININYNPDTRLLTGTEEIDYINNSADVLHEIVFKLYPNIYKKGNIRDLAVEATDLTDGVTIQSISLNGNNSSFNIKGTNMIVPYTMVQPKQKIHFNIKYHYCPTKLQIKGQF
ncbi:MAG: hypothetical protein HYR66_18760 [Sphingobacteriales bacterium]|nr:hypothetical protein [Sphingobacteriales bacterium]MBI3718801.1 hypothetical protein [Sphingobacteriales bacterium]